MHIRAVLSEEDQATLFNAAKEQGLTSKQLADSVGINRTYMYGALSCKQLELTKVLKLQKVLGLEFIKDDDIRIASTVLGAKILEAVYE